MQAIILCGGKGTRLGLKSKPKPMVMVNGKPLLEHTVDLLIDNGFSEIIFLNGHLSNKIEKYFTKEKYPNIKIKHKKEARPLGTAGCINQVKEELNNWFFVIYGDLMINVNFKKFYDTAKNNSGLGTLFVHPNGHPCDSDLIKVGNKNKIEEIFLKPHSKKLITRNIVNAAIYCLNKNILKHVPKNDESDWMNDVFINVKNKLFAYQSSEIVFDVGTRQRIKKARNSLNENFYDNHRKAVFVDRDGVLNKEINGVYKPDDLKLLPGVSSAIKKLNEKNILIICVTNQPGIAKGFINEKDLDGIHSKLDFLLGKDGAYLDDILYCPHHPEKGWKGERKDLKIKCECRKPGIKLFQDAIEKHNIDISNSYFISDTVKDLEVTNMIKITPLLVMTGYGKMQVLNDKKISRFPDFKTAVNNILNNSFHDHI